MYEVLVDPQQVWAYRPQYEGARVIDLAWEKAHPLYSLSQAIGCTFESEGRIWTVKRFFLPLTKGRGIRAGVRARVQDQFGIISFCNQRDLELLLEVKKPGEWCWWLGDKYPQLHDAGNFYGLCADEVDLMDDLHLHEWELREQYHYGILPGGLTYDRLVHKERGCDYQQRLMLMFDADRTTGVAPDNRFETLMHRWQIPVNERVQ